MNFKIKVTPEQSIAVQRHCFNNGITWANDISSIQFTNKKYLFIYLTEYRIRMDEFEDLFNESKNIEVSPEVFCNMSYDDMITGKSIVTGTTVHGCSEVEDNDNDLKPGDTVYIKCTIEDYHGVSHGYVLKTISINDEEEIIDIYFDEAQLHRTLPEPHSDCPESTESDSTDFPIPIDTKQEKVFKIANRKASIMFNNIDLSEELEDEAILKNREVLK